MNIENILKKSFSNYFNNEIKAVIIDNSVNLKLFKIYAVSLFLFYVYVCAPAWVYVYHEETRRGSQIPWSCSYRPLSTNQHETQLGSSAKTLPTLNFWAIFPALLLQLNNKRKGPANTEEICLDDVYL